MNNYFLRIAAFSGALAVALGAFGAHALRSLLSEKILDAYQTGVLYHFVHTLLLAIIGILYQQNSNAWLRRAGFLLIAGLLLFSGSLYMMAFLYAGGFGFATKLGMITPFGGLAFIAGWLCMFRALLAKEN